MNAYNRNRTGRTVRLSAMIAAALLANVAVLQPTGAASADASASTVIATVPFEGSSYAAWIVHHPGGDVLSIGVEVAASIAPDSGAFSFMATIQKVGAETGAISMSTLQFDDVDGIHVSSTPTSFETEFSTYEGAPFTHLTSRKVLTETGHYFPPGDYYFIAALAQDGGAFSGEFRLLSDDGTIVASEVGEPFYHRHTDFPAAVNARVKHGPHTVHTIEAGLVEREVTGKLFAMLAHSQPRPAVMPGAASGLWVEEPGAEGPVARTQGAVDLLTSPCRDPPYPPPACHLGDAADAPFEGQVYMNHPVIGGEAGTYRFRVDHWNAVEGTDVLLTPGYIALLGADVKL